MGRPSMHHILAVWLYGLVVLVSVLRSKILLLLTRECSLALNMTICRTCMLVWILRWTPLLRNTLETLSRRMILWQSSRPGSQAVQFKLWISCDYAFGTPSTKTSHCVKLVERCSVALRGVNNYSSVSVSGGSTNTCSAPLNLSSKATGASGLMISQPATSLLHLSSFFNLSARSSTSVGGG